MISKNLNEFNKILFDSWIGYIYLYDEKNNIWLWDNYSINNSKLTLKPLGDYFQKLLSTKIENISCSEVKGLRDKDYEFLVLQGCSGNLNDWINSITDLFKENGIVDDSFLFSEIYSFENNGVTNMALALNDKSIDMRKLAKFRITIKDKFDAMQLSDYIDNGYIKGINI